MKIESVILTNLLKNEEYVKKVSPYIKPEYFEDPTDKAVYEVIYSYIDKYKSVPTKEAVMIEMDSINLTDKQILECKNYIGELSKAEIEKNLDWIVETTEQWCKDRAIFNTVMESVQILQGESQKDKGALPQMFMDALAVSFDPHIGHDYLESAKERYEFLHRKDLKFPFDIDDLNEITAGGVSPKTLNILMCGTGGGKTLGMCHFAANDLSNGRNVLYITMEISEEWIAQRIDANLLNIHMSDIINVPCETYVGKINKLKQKTTGKLIIKEYPEGANVNNFRHLLNELKLKQRFKPDIIYIDYLAICGSVTYRNASNQSSFTVQKAISQELRSLGKEFIVPIWTAVQTNRSGYESSDSDLTDIAESFGITHTADLFLSVVTNEELAKIGQYMFKQLKNRYTDKNRKLKFMVGVDRSKQRLYNLDDSSNTSKALQKPEVQPDDDTPVFDRGKKDLDFSDFK